MLRIFRKKYPVVRQHDESDCAAAALATICKFYKKELTIMKVREIIGTDAYGTSVQGIVSGAEKLGFEAKAIKIPIDEIDSAYTLPAIAHVTTETGLNHFVVINKIKNGKFWLSDPAKGAVEQTKEELTKRFTGVLVILLPKSEFETNYLAKTTMWQLFKMVMLPHKKMLATVILCSFALTVLGILSSLFSKVVFDEIIPYQLKKTLYVYLIIFAFVGLIQVFLSYFRTHVLLFLSRKIDIPVLLGYYNHVLRLPYQFFATRRVGDILTRFQDAMTIKDIFSQVSVSLVLDLSLAVFTGIALVKINLMLFILVLTVVLANVALIYLFKKSYKRISELGTARTQTAEKISELDSQKKLKQTDTNLFTLIANKDGVVHYLTPVKTGLGLQGFQPIAQMDKGKNSKLVGEVYISAQDRSKIKVGNTTKLSLAGVNQTKYGLLTGKIKSISDGTITQGSGEQTQVLYQVNVALDKMTLTSGGEEILAKASMPTVASIVYEKENYMEWLLEQLNFMKEK